MKIDGFKGEPPWLRQFGLGYWGSAQWSSPGCYPTEGISGTYTVGGVIIAYLVRNVLEGAPLLPADDTLGYVILAVAALVAMGRLR